MPAPGPIPDRHESETRVDFHANLDAMDDSFVAAGIDVAEALPRLTDGFLGGDHAIIREAIDLSIAIGDTCEAIEEKGFVLLARESPVAIDLRRLVALLRLTTDIDRSAALLKHVCLTLERFDPRFLSDALRTQMAELADQATAVFRSGIDAWRRRDALAVHEIDDADSAVDRLEDRLLEEAAAAEQAGDELLVLGLIARYYERIADHGVAIARDAAFVATGQRVPVGKRRQDADGSDKPGAED